MTLLRTFLSKSKVKKVLSSKPGQEGFSLIELVVVVAVLAVLSAIAIPQFTNISGKARAVAASNTLATIAKECAAKIADQGVGANATFVVPALQGYDNDNNDGTKGFFMGGAEKTIGSQQNCPNSGLIEFRSDDVSEYPTWKYDVGSGVKTCATSGAGSNAAKRGCTGTSW